MKIISWNVNGLGRNFNDVKRLIEEFHPDFLCLQKVRNDRTREKYKIEGYKQLYIASDLGRDSGVLTYAKIPSDIKSEMAWFSLPNHIKTDPFLSRDGHLQVLNCGDFALINAYVPFSNSKITGAIEYRKEWDSHFIEFIADLSSKMPIIVCGDFNVVHKKLDTCQDKVELNKPCFYKWERDNFNALLDKGDLIDVFRFFHPRKQAVTIFGIFRPLNYGDRIDYFLASRRLKEKLIDSSIISEFVDGASEPISLELNTSIEKKDEYSISWECAPFIDGFEQLKEIHSYNAFHDNILHELRYILNHDGCVIIDFSIRDISLRFFNVHCFESDISDVRSSFFYGIKFYVSAWNGYGDCIVMETDGDFIKIIAERILVKPNPI